MKFRVCLEEWEHSGALEYYVRTKITSSLKEFANDDIQVDIRVESSGRDQSQVTATLSEEGKIYEVHEGGRYVYDCVDRLASKVEALFRKHHSGLFTPPKGR
jgi:ribosome-associated translation inhibitor RaiA